MSGVRKSHDPVARTWKVIIILKDDGGVNPSEIFTEEDIKMFISEQFDLPAGVSLVSITIQ